MVPNLSAEVQVASCMIDAKIEYLKSVEPWGITVT